MPMSDDTERCGTHGCDGEAVAVYKWTNIVTGEAVKPSQCEDCEPDELEPLRRLEANDHARGRRARPMTGVSYIRERAGRGLKVALGRFQFAVFVGARRRETAFRQDTGDSHE